MPIFTLNVYEETLNNVSLTIWGDFLIPQNWGKCLNSIKVKLFNFTWNVWIELKIMSVSLLIYYHRLCNYSWILCDWGCVSFDSKTAGSVGLSGGRTSFAWLWLLFWFSASLSDGWDSEVNDLPLSDVFSVFPWGTEFVSWWHLSHKYGWFAQLFSAGGLCAVTCCKLATSGSL